MTSSMTHPSSRPDTAHSHPARGSVIPLGNGAMTMDNQRGVLTMAPLLERVTPAVVSIDIRGTAKTPAMSGRSEELFERFFGGQMPNAQPREKRGLGSGVIVDASKGLIITNAHVIDGADEITVTLEDKRRLCYRGRQSLWLVPFCDLGHCLCFGP